MKIRILLLTLIITLLNGCDDIGDRSVSLMVIERIESVMKPMLGGRIIDRITSTPLNGWYLVTVDSKQLLIDKSARYAFRGTRHETGIVKETVGDSEALQVTVAQTVAPRPLVSINLLSDVGWHEIETPGAVFYLSQNGKYFLNGNLFDIKNNFSSITARSVNRSRIKAVQNFDERDYVIYTADNQQTILTVFTDVDCAYCQKFHKQLKEYADAGITIRYLAFPRAGIESDSYRKWVSVWCAKDRQQAMSQIKAKETLENRVCNNPVKEMVRLSQLFGLKGTPSFLFENGVISVGNITPQIVLNNKKINDTF